MSVPRFTVTPSASSWRLISAKSGSASPRRELAAEAADRRVVRDALAAEAGEAEVGEVAVQRLLHGRVGEAVPLLQQHDLQHRQRRIGGPPRRRGVHPGDDFGEPLPVDQRVDALQPRVAAEALRLPPLRQRPVPCPLLLPRTPARSSFSRSGELREGLARGEGEGEGFGKNARGHSPRTSLRARPEAAMIASTPRTLPRPMPRWRAAPPHPNPLPPEERGPERKGEAVGPGPSVRRSGRCAGACAGRSRRGCTRRACRGW